MCWFFTSVAYEKIFYGSNDQMSVTFCWFQLIIKLINGEILNSAKVIGRVDLLRLVIELLHERTFQFTGVYVSGSQIKKLE